MAANMIGVRFREAAKMYHFAPPEHGVSVGDYVVVESARGLEMARVVTVPDAAAGEVPDDARPIVRLADQSDRDSASRMRDRGGEILERIRRLTVAHNLDMYAMAVQVNLAGTDATVHFQADKHVDFRELIEALEAEYEIRVHMQQAGPRDRAKLVDGYDICGLRLCCASWMTSFPQVGIRMAKAQDLSLNPDKISGVCGRLLCCLTFEYDVYREMRGTLPKVGRKVSTPAGMGKVVQVNTLKQTVMVILEDAPGRVEVSAAEIGTTVRVEAEPNQALVDALRGAPEPAGLAEAAAVETATEDEPDAAESDQRPRRRRRRRRKRSDGEGAGADAGPTRVQPGERGAQTPTAAESNASDTAGEPRLRRRRRRRRRPRASGNGPENASQEQAPEEQTPPDAS